ncbi:MAG TPA: hypothetical protein VFV39_03750 [Limnobacter sp.]|nr:hypothetical protein [Limnobacter sp.]
MTAKRARKLLLHAMSLLPVAGTTAALANPPQAILQIQNPALHCGIEVQLNLYEGLVQALTDQPEATASELALKDHQRQLELVIHFPNSSAEIPPDCKARLLDLSARVKSGEVGPLVIRSANRGAGSTEFDLAKADERLQAVHAFFRDDRLARKAFVVELHPETSSPLIGWSLRAPQVVEIYSSPAS